MGRFIPMPLDEPTRRRFLIITNRPRKLALPTLQIRTPHAILDLQPTLWRIQQRLEAKAINVQARVKQSQERPTSSPVA
jgi:5-formyltetrahydrofolate cyclo-ligase